MESITANREFRDIVPLRQSFIEFSSDAQSELKSYLGAIGEIEIREAGPLETLVPRESDLPTCRAELAVMHAKAMKDGFVVIRRIPGIPFQQRFALGWVFATVIGTPLIQKIDSGAKNVMVYDRDGTSMRQGARYHQSRDGGSIHTDNVNNPTPWKTMVLSCVQPALDGGESIYVDGQDVVGYLGHHNPQALETLAEEFWFDGRGFDQMFSSPVLLRDGDNLKVRYLREYIEEGHALRGVPLTQAQVEAMDALDAALTRRQLQLRYRMKAGEVTIINDSRMFHGRTAFTDPLPPQLCYEPGSKNRLFTRIWVDE